MRSDARPRRRESRERSGPVDARDRRHRPSLDMRHTSLSRPSSDPESSKPYAIGDWHGLCWIASGCSCEPLMSETTLSISSKNYSSWSLRGWLMARLARIDFEEVVVAPDDADARAEILLLSPSIRVPCLAY